MQRDAILGRIVSVRELDANLARHSRKAPVGVLIGTAWQAAKGTVPHAELMGVVGLAALVGNGVVALMLFAYESGEATYAQYALFAQRPDRKRHRPARWGGAFGTGTGWPDFGVALIMVGFLNLNTAKSLGLNVPQSLVVRANEVIE